MAGIVACSGNETTGPGPDTGGAADASPADASADEGDLPAPDTGDTGAPPDANADANTDADADDNDADAGAAAAPRGLACIQDPACTAPLVAAHRGVHDVAPENSLASIRLGAALGVDFVELDIRHTADDQLVVIHDPTVDRTTTGTGDVEAATLDQLRALRLLGATDEPDTQQIPTFAEALAWAVRYDVDLYLDVKTDRITDVVDAIVEAGALDHAWLRDDLDPVARAVAHASDTHGVAPAVLVPVSSVAELEAARVAVPTRLSIEVPGGAGVPSDVVAAAHAAGIRVQQDALGFADLFGLDDDPSAWQAMYDAGVDVVQTDLPRRLLAHLGRELP